VNWNKNRATKTEEERGGGGRGVKDRKGKR
jgi:hypothetical protein